MDAFWHDVAQVMDCERCLVGNGRLRNTFLVSTPEGPTDQVLALARRKVAQAKDAAVDQKPVSPATVEMLLPVCITCCSGLGSGKVSALRSCDVVECLSVRLRISSHSQTPYILCKEFA